MLSGSLRKFEIITQSESFSVEKSQEHILRDLLVR